MTDIYSSGVLNARFGKNLWKHYVRFFLGEVFIKEMYVLV